MATLVSGSVPNLFNLFSCLWVLDPTSCPNKTAELMTGLWVWWIRKPSQRSSSFPGYDCKPVGPRDINGSSINMYNRANEGDFIQLPYQWIHLSNSSLIGVPSKKETWFDVRNRVLQMASLQKNRLCFEHSRKPEVLWLISRQRFAVNVVFIRTMPLLILYHYLLNTSVFNCFEVSIS